MKRHEVFKSGRIKVTEDLIRKLDVTSVLEVGAGDYSFEYVKDRAKISWKKVDFAPPCDAVCDFNSETLVLPFEDGSFDLVICTEVLEHLLWPQRLLKESHRVLSSQGKLLVSVPNIVSLTYRLALLIGHLPSCAASGNLPPKLGSTAYETNEGTLTGGHVIDFDKKRLVRLLASEGFRISELKGSGIIWHRQILPCWLVPAGLSSNLICLAEK